VPGPVSKEAYFVRYITLLTVNIILATMLGPKSVVIGRGLSGKNQCGGKFAVCAIENFSRGRETTHCNTDFLLDLQRFDGGNCYQTVEDIIG
jgi:hypothetical protein